MQDFFCPLPFTEVFVHETAAPCCVFRSNKPIPLQGYSTNPIIKQVKQQLFFGHAPKECRHCQAEEQITGGSFRTLANQFHVETIRRIRESGPEYHDIKIMNISTGTLCNLKCLPCEHSSHVRQKELFDLGFVSQLTPPIYAPPIGTDDISGVDTINFTGGEPFFDGTFGIIEQIISTGLSKSINVSINTNLTAITMTRLTWLLDNFKSVLIKGSIDGVDKVNDYLRYPSKWDQIRRAVDMVLESDCDFVMTTALSNLALCKYHELAEWALELGIKDLFVSQVTTPDVLSCQTFFPEQRDESIESLRKLLSRPNLSDRTQYCLDLCINICNNAREADVFFRQRLRHYLDAHDHKRGTSWQQVFDDIIL